jgi:hypothetical protein
MPTGFPRGQLQFTSAKVIVARAFAPPGAKTAGARRAFDSTESTHGTHVAGIAAGNASTAASGGRVVSGVAPRAYIGNYKALVRTDSGLSPNGNSPELVAAIEAAVADGMDVINLSLGEPEIEPRRDIVALALDAAAAAGVVPVVAAGNDYNDAGAGSVSSPANSEQAIAVGALEVSGSQNRSVHADFSSVGPTTLSLQLKPEVAAPGVDVLSSVPDNGWASFSGTSMASPHVAGAAALLQERHPAWSVTQIKSALVTTGRRAETGGDAVAGPTFVGGGLVSLPDADRPLFFSNFPALSFDLLEGRNYEVPRELRLTDAGGGAGAWNVSVEYVSRARGTTLDIGSTQATVPGVLSMRMMMGNAVANGDTSGYVTLRRGTDVRRIPFWGRMAVPQLGKHRLLPLRSVGLYNGTTAGRPALVTRYRYPEDPSGMGVTTVLRGPEATYRVSIGRRVANFGVVITEQARGTRVEARVVSGTDENRLMGFSALPVNHNPYLDDFREAVPAVAALSPLPGTYTVVFDSAQRAGAGRFTFRYWVNDVTPPVLRVRSRSVPRGRPLLVAAIDRGAGVDPGLTVASVDGDEVSAVFSRGVIRIQTSGLSAGRHTLRLRVSDYQETKNTENVARILPNTRTLTTTFAVR